MGNERHIAAIFDLDGTISRRDTYLAYLTGFALRHPKRWRRMPGLLFDVLRFKLGLKNNTWLKERFLAAVLGGISRQSLRMWTVTFNEKLIRNGLRPQALRQIREYKEQGLRLILISASPDLYVDDLSRHLGFSESICTRVEWGADSRLTGRLHGKNCYGAEKCVHLERCFGEERQRWHVIAYSDHHSDLPLLTWADQGVAVSPTRRLAREARRKGLTVLSW